MYTFAHTHAGHTLTLYLFGLVMIDDINPHSSRMGMGWGHGLLLWNLEKHPPVVIHPTGSTCMITELEIQGTLGFGLW